MRRTLQVILNPIAGASRSQRAAATLAALRARGCDLEVRETERKGDAQRFAAAARGASIDALVVAGGDGTINEAINGLVEAGETGGAAPPLAILPLGTANVLAAEIGLDLAPESLAATIAEGPARAICLGRARQADGATRVFTQMAGAGFDAHVVAHLDLALKRCIGKGAYVWQSLVELLRFGHPRYRVTLDGVAVEAASVIVANGRCYGGPYVVAPDASLAAPSFQVCLFATGGVGAVLRGGLALLRNRIADLPDVRLVTARAVTIEGPAGDPVQGDGDIIARLPVTLSVLPDALQLVMPA